MLQKIKDEVKRVKLKHRTAWRRLVRGNELDSPGMATANRSGPMKLTMIDMVIQRLRYAQGPTRYKGTGRQGDQADDK